MTSDMNSTFSKLGITLPASLVKQIDHNRRDIPRSTYIRRTLDIVKFSKLLRKKIYFDTFANIPITESKLGEIICQKCGNTNYKKFGIRHNKDSGDIQRYLCKDCRYRFIVNPAFENCKASAKIITAAIDLYFKGVSTRKTANHIKQLYNFSIDDSSICRWIRKFVELVQPYVDGLVPKMGGVLMKCYYMFAKKTTSIQ